MNNRIIKLSKPCIDCQFYCDSEDDLGYCTLLLVDMEKDDDFEPLRPEKCKTNMYVNIICEVEP